MIINGAGKDNWTCYCLTIKNKIMERKIVSFQILPIEPKFYYKLDLDLIISIPFVAKYSMVVLYDNGTMGTKISNDGINFVYEDQYSLINRVYGDYIIDFLQILISYRLGYFKAKSYLSNAISKTKVSTDEKVGIYLSDDYYHGLDYIFKCCQEFNKEYCCHLYKKVLRRIIRDGIKTCEDLINTNIQCFKDKGYKRADISRIETLKRYLNGY